MKSFKTYFILLLFLLLMGCNSLFPSIGSPPEILTKDAKNIEEKCAVLSGKIINDGGGCLEVGFEYYKGIESDNILSVSKEGSYSCEIFEINLPEDSLESDTNYHFRAYAKNVYGFGYGEWLSFTTLKDSQTQPPPTTSPSSSNNKIVIDKTNGAIDELEKLLDSGTSVSQGIDSVVEWLEQQPEISKVIQKNNLIEIFFASGIESSILIYDSSADYIPLGSSSKTKSIISKTQKKGKLCEQGLRLVRKNSFISRSENIINMENRKVLFWDCVPPILYHDIIDLSYLLVESSLDFSPINFKYMENANIDSLRNITDYGLVVFYTHGREGKWLATGEIPTYPYKFEKNRISHLVSFDISSFTAEYAYAVSYKWFEENLQGQFPNTVIISLSCESAMTTYLWDVFYSKGAGAYYGYDDISGYPVSHWHGGGILQGLAEGKTTGQCYSFPMDIPFEPWSLEDACLEVEASGKKFMLCLKMFGNENLTFAPPVETFTITASAGSNGSIVPSGEIIVEQGSDQSFTITPNANYQVADVLVDGSSVGAESLYTFNNVTEDHSISANFIEEVINHAPVIDSSPITTATQEEIYIYNVNAVDSDGDDLIYSLTTKPNGMIINSSTGLITWTPSSTGDYDVTVKVSDGELFDTQEYAITVSTVIPETYTITASVGPNGSISPSGNVTVNEGSDKSFTVTPDTGYQIDDVLVDGSSVGAISSYTFNDVNEDHTISASFNLIASNGPVHNLTKDTYYDTLQAALTEADVGDSIEVSGGNYDFGSLNVSGIEIILNPGNYLFGNLVLESGAKFLITSDTSLEGFKGANIIADNINIGNDCIISANETGYLPMDGPGAGESNIYCDSWRRGAAGYGGKGGSTGYIGTYGIVLINANGGDSYGNLSEPIDLGSGGQYYTGGGAIKIEVSGTLKNEGIISANGKGPLAGSSGGSIWIQANNLTGMGNISTNGGSGSWDDLVEIFQGSGAGGRICIEYNTSDFPIENLFCKGGEIINNIPEKCKEKALGENGTIVINGTQIQ